MHSPSSSTEPRAHGSCTAVEGWGELLQAAMGSVLPWDCPSAHPGALRAHSGPCLITVTFRIHHMSALHKFGWLGPDDVVPLKFRLNSLMMSQSCDPCQLWGHHTTPGWALLLLPGTALGQGQQNTSVAPGSPCANSCCWNVTDVIFLCSQLAPTTAPPAHPVPSPAPGTSPTHQCPCVGAHPCNMPKGFGSSPQHSQGCLPVTVGHPHPSFSLPITHRHHQHLGSFQDI